jgi:magnesium transporter
MSTNDMIILTYFIGHHPGDVARLMEHLKIQDIVSLLKEIPADQTVTVFQKLDRFTALKCLETLGIEKSAEIVEALPHGIASVLLRQLQEKLRESILGTISEAVSLPLRRILSYPANSAGALTDPMVLSLPDDLAVKEGQKRVLKSPEKTIYYLYVVSREEILRGVITLRELMLAKPTAQLKMVMNTDVTRLSAELTFQAILDHPGWQEYHTLPVVEKNDIFLGVIRYEMLKRIERESKRSRLPRQMIAAGNALGELYQIGLSGLLKSASIAYQDSSEEK